MRRPHDRTNVAVFGWLILGMGVLLGVLLTIAERTGIGRHASSSTLVAIIAYGFTFTGSALLALARLLKSYDERLASLERDNDVPGGSDSGSRAAPP
jgi:hypothetical protein